MTSPSHSEDPIRLLQTLVHSRDLDEESALAHLLEDGETLLAGFVQQELQQHQQQRTETGVSDGRVVEDSVSGVSSGSSSARSLLLRRESSRGSWTSTEEEVLEEDEEDDDMDEQEDEYDKEVGGQEVGTSGDESESSVSSRGRVPSLYTDDSDEDDDGGLATDDAMTAASVRKRRRSSGLFQSTNSDEGTSANESSEVLSVDAAEGIRGTGLFLPNPDSVDSWEHGFVVQPVRRGAHASNMPSMTHGPADLGVPSSSGAPRPEVHRREKLIVLLLQKVCAFTDPTPRTFLRNCHRMYELGILSSLSFLDEQWAPGRLLRIEHALADDPEAAALAASAASSANREQSADAMHSTDLVKLNVGVQRTGPHVSKYAGPALPPPHKRSVSDASIASSILGGIGGNTAAPAGSADVALMSLLNSSLSRYRSDFIEVGRIGKGGFGKVFKAQHRIDGVAYAIKQITFGQRGFTPVFHRKVLREVKCLAKLDHPNICRYYNAWVEPVWEEEEAAAARRWEIERREARRIKRERRASADSHPPQAGDSSHGSGSAGLGPHALDLSGSSSVVSHNQDGSGTQQTPLQRSAQPSTAANTGPQSTAVGPYAGPVAHLRESMSLGSLGSLGSDGYSLSPVGTNDFSQDDYFGSNSQVSSVDQEEDPEPVVPVEEPETDGALARVLLPDGLHAAASRPSQRISSPGIQRRDLPFSSPSPDAAADGFVERLKLKKKKSKKKKHKPLHLSKGPSEDDLMGAAKKPTRAASPGDDAPSSGRRRPRRRRSQSERVAADSDSEEEGTPVSRVSAVFPFADSPRSGAHNQKNKEKDYRLQREQTEKRKRRKRHGSGRRRRAFSETLASSHARQRSTDEYLMQFAPAVPMPEDFDDYDEFRVPAGSDSDDSSDDSSSSSDSGSDSDDASMLDTETDTSLDTGFDHMPLDNSINSLDEDEEAGPDAESQPVPSTPLRSALSAALAMQRTTPKRRNSLQLKEAQAQLEHEDLSPMKLGSPARNPGATPQIERSLPPLHSQGPRGAHPREEVEEDEEDEEEEEEEVTEVEYDVDVSVDVYLPGSSDAAANMLASQAAAVAAADAAPRFALSQVTATPPIQRHRSDETSYSRSYEPRTRALDDSPATGQWVPHSAPNPSLTPGGTLPPSAMHRSINEADESVLSFSTSPTEAENHQLGSFIAEHVHGHATAHIHARRTETTGKAHRKKSKRSSDAPKHHADNNLPLLARLPPLWAQMHSGTMQHRVRLFIQTELCEDLTLSHWIRYKHRPTTPEVNMPMIFQILCGLEHVHHMGVMHRDLKPSNLFLTLPAAHSQYHAEVLRKITPVSLAGVGDNDEDESSSGSGSRSSRSKAKRTSESSQRKRLLLHLMSTSAWPQSSPYRVKIGDFGLAKDYEVELGEGVGASMPPPRRSASVGASSSSSSNAANRQINGVGTLTYSAPEQLSGKLYSTASDIYSLGVIMFELYHPCTTGMERAVLMRNLQQGHLSPEFEARYPHESRLIRRMTALDPSQRPTSSELLGDPYIARFAPVSKHERDRRQYMAFRRMSSEPVDPLTPPGLSQPRRDSASSVRSDGSTGTQDSDSSKSMDSSADASLAHDPPASVPLENLSREELMRLVLAQRGVISDLRSAND